MIDSSQGATARIYHFPVRDRASKPSQGPRKPADLASVRYAKADFGSGWYHEAAIEDAEPARKR